MPVDAHILITTDELLTEELVKSAGSDLSKALGRNRLENYDGRGVIFREKERDYDLLPDGMPRARSVLRVRLCTPYYGQGYERGYWPELATALEFLRQRFPTARVWYGRDDSDQVQEVTPELLNQLCGHWAMYGGRPYHASRSGVAW